MTPSVNTLSLIHGIDHKQSLLLRKLLEGKVKPQEVSKDCDKWVNTCYTFPSWHERVLEAANEIIGGHGIETLDLDDDRYTDGNTAFCPRYSYVNLGDPYLTTLLRDHKNSRFIVASYGEIVEKAERRQ